MNKNYSNNEFDLNKIIYQLCYFIPGGMGNPRWHVLHQIFGLLIAAELLSAPKYFLLILIVIFSISLAIFFSGFSSLAKSTLLGKTSFFVAWQ